VELKVGAYRKGLRPLPLYSQGQQQRKRNALLWPLTRVRAWQMGYAQLSTTAIYVDFCGAEAKNLAARMWE